MAINSLKFTFQYTYYHMTDQDSKIVQCYKKKPEQGLWGKNGEIISDFRGGLWGVREGFLEEIASELNEKGLWDKDLFQGSGGSVLVRMFYSFYMGRFWDCFLTILIVLITVDLQCCVNFRCRAKWLSYIYTYIHSLCVCVCVCVCIYPYIYIWIYIYSLSLLRYRYSPSCGKMEPGRDDQSMASRSHERDRFPCKFYFKNKHEDKNWPVSIVSTIVKLYYVFWKAWNLQWSSVLPSPFQDMGHKETDSISLLFWSKQTHMLLETTSSEPWLYLVLLMVQNAERINFWALLEPTG